MKRANVELKARCGDLDAVRRRARALATSWLGREEQTDTYFHVPRGRLKLRESSRSGGQLVPYLRPDAAAARRSDYCVEAVGDPAGLKVLLGAILGVRCVVRKQREVGLYENVRIHLDRVEGQGVFVELEAVYDPEREDEDEQRRKVRFLADALGLRDEDLVAQSYGDAAAASPPG
jgi:predicted adenylyl cyclase CyaB